MATLGAVISAATTRLQTKYPTVLSVVGYEHLKENDTAPRVVWVPTADTFAGAKLQKIEPRQLHTRSAGVEAHVWAVGSGGGATADLDATETLANDVIAALHQVTPGNYQVTGGTWAQAAKTHLGRVYVLNFVINLPITVMTGYDTVTITAETRDVQLTFS